MPAGSTSNGSNKQKNSKSDSADNIIQFTKTQFDDVVSKMISKATEPLKAELHALKIEVEQLRESQKFVSNQNDDLTKTYSSVLQTYTQQKQDLTNLRKQTDDFSKRRCDDELKIDELEQYDRRQNLELQGIPLKNNEDITQITLDLAKQLDVELEEEDISIVYRLPPKQHMPRLTPKTTGKPINRHPTVIVRFVSRQKRNETYANRFKAKSIEEFPVEGMQNLFVNENLTQRRKQLF